MQGKGYIGAREKGNLSKGIEGREGWRTGDKGRQMVGGDSASSTDVKAEIVSVC